MVYPTMTQKFFGHFNCRQLGTGQWALVEGEHGPRTCAVDRITLKLLHILSVSADYSITCYDSNLATRWWVLAAVSLFGIATVSVGVPLGMFIWMRRSFNREMAMVLERKKARVTA